MNMEMLFRAANSTGGDSISLEEFRVFLQRLKISLKDSCIQRFLYLLDEDFSGTISYKEYIDTLVAFGANTESNTFK